MENFGPTDKPCGALPIRERRLKLRTYIGRKMANGWRESIFSTPSDRGLTAGGLAHKPSGRYTRAGYRDFRYPGRYTTVPHDLH
jgi:hypothetical protein